jgi:hypothetical protein
LPNKDQLVKESEYHQNYDKKTPDQYKPAHPKVEGWKPITLPNEKKSKYTRDYVSFPVTRDPKEQAAYKDAFFRNRNPALFGYKGSPFEGHTNYKDEYTKKKGDTPTLFTFDPRASGSKDMANFKPKGYPSFNGHTTYKDVFVDYHVQHCDCRNMANPKKLERKGSAPSSIKTEPNKAGSSK